MLGFGMIIIDILVVKAVFIFVIEFLNIKYFFVEIFNFLVVIKKIFGVGFLFLIWGLFLIII